MALTSLVMPTKGRLISTVCKVIPLYNNTISAYWANLQFESFCLLNASWNFHVVVRGKKTLTDELHAYKSIPKELNLPDPPKKPTTPALTFMNEERKKVPEMNVRDAVKHLSEVWNGLSESEKSRYKLGYAQEIIKYKEREAQYETKLTEEQRHKVKVLILEKKKEQLQKEVEKLSRDNKKEAELLGKPKMPGNTVGLYWKTLMDKSGSSKKSTLSEAIQKWNDLPDSEKEKYKALFKEKISAYKLELDQWEKRMIEEGKPHLVRKSSLK